MVRFISMPLDKSVLVTNVTLIHIT